MKKEALERIERERQERTGKLDLSFMTLTEIPKKVSEMVWLRQLNLMVNQITEIKGLERLTNLEELDLNYNKISEIKGLETLTNLQRLDLSDQRISEIKGLDKLKSLKWLDLSNTFNIKEIKGLEALTELEVLFLHTNHIEEIKGLEVLTNLKRVDLSFNQISHIPEQVVVLEHLNDLNVKGNPIETPPYEICLGGIDSIRSWYKSAEKIYQDTKGTWHIVEDHVGSVEMVPLRELKLVLIGNGNVGKTSLALRLRDRKATLPTPTERTDGLATYKWDKNVSVPEEGEPQSFRFNIWDFGGQGKFRAVQQLFCHRRSLYLYVTSPDDSKINSQEDYRDFSFWLSMIRAYSYDPKASHASPVIHVSNKIDLGAVNVNEEAMEEIYPDLHPGTVRTSAHTNEGLDGLEKKIEEVLPKVSFDVFTSTYSPSWLELKEALEERPVDYILLAEYEQLARAHGLSEEETKHWLRVLHRLGTVIYFEALSALQDTVFLKPEWVRKAAYGILSSEAIAEHYGQFREGDFSKIWPEHSAAEHQKLIALMLAFELCYLKKDDFGKDIYMAPALFPAQPPQNYNFIEFSTDNYPILELRLLFQPFFPAGLLHRLVVRLHSLLYRSYSWRKGAVLYAKDTYAEITEDWENKQLLVKLKGPSPEALFTRISQEVEQIIGNLKSDQMILNLDVTSEGLLKEDWLKLAQIERYQMDFWKQKAPASGVNLFISYARKDEPFKDQLVNHLSGLRRNKTITDWNDRQILPGQDWDKVIKEKLESSQIVLFLVSSDFLSSDYINDVEIARTIQRHNQGTVTIVPILIRPCDFSSLEISMKQALPLAPGKGLKSVSKWANRDEAWMKVVDGLKPVIYAKAPGQREVQ